MPRKKATKVEKVVMPTKAVGIPPKPREKLIPGQVLYSYHPVEGYIKMIYEKPYKGENEILCRDEKGQGWILNDTHLHNTILTENEYLGRLDKSGS